ncbi:nucleotidyltransferase domain-containing protein [Streptomyces sp. NBC_00388]|uniref:nucleotidyltransferase domain-containing protein n=1 Tax=Streptomyces sp. NBC_00388 TaxID=2975735 RepID=UPI002E21E092
MKASLNGCLEELERRELLPPDHLAVICVGSVARGWANEMSDYDFNVISRSSWQGDSTRTIPVPLRPDTVPAAVVYVDGRRWEVKYWQDTQVDQMLAKVTWDQFEEGNSTAKALIDAEELFLERLATCITLSGTSWVRARRQGLEGTAFRAFVTTRSLAEADEAVEDALGQLAANDTDSAVLSARKAFGHVVDALLESHGAFGSRTPKWRARRFREAQPKQLSYAEYWATETMSGFSPEEPGAWVTRVMEQCRDLSIEVEIQ